MYLFVIGTRPEAIKICPIILKFKEKKVPYKVLLTGQHTTLVDEVMKIFDIKVDYNLNIMKKSQSLGYIISSIMSELDKIFATQEFSHVIVHGDTTTAMASALCAFQNRIKIIHIEAGLRTKNLHTPFPEEANRRIISVLSDVSFIPTEDNYNNLVLENNKSAKFVVGNTIIDAIEIIIKKYKLPNDIINEKFILLTTHRRENIEHMKDIFSAIDNIANKFKINVVLPMHPNPEIRKIFDETVKNNKYIKVIEPQNYVNFCNLLIQCELIVTDSGGVQEEASHLKKPIIILREETERQEAVNGGNAILVGTDKIKIEKSISSILEKKKAQNKGSESIFGNGDTCEKIYEILKDIKI